MYEIINLKIMEDIFEDLMGNLLLEYVMYIL